MVAAMLCRGYRQTGMHRFDVSRDMGAVTELIAVAFGDRLDPAGRAALAEMRRIARWGPLLSWLYLAMWDGIGSARGFVWVEDGCVVGNVSLRRAVGGDGFMIGNLAVHPDWQGRGIGRALMEAALEEVYAQGGRWAGLEVQVDNQAAYRLYEHLGFEEIGRILHMLRPMGLPRAGRSWEEAEGGHRLRRGRGRDGAMLLGLMRVVVPEPQRSLLEVRPEDYQPGWQRALELWFEGRREVWWVIDEGGVICGAARMLHERGLRPSRLEVLIAPEHEGRFEDILVQRTLASLHEIPKRMTEILIPSPTKSLVAALESAGFQELRALVQMRRGVSAAYLSGTRWYAPE